MMMMMVAMMLMMMVLVLLVLVMMVMSMIWKLHSIIQNPNRRILLMRTPTFYAWIAPI